MMYFSRCLGVALGLAALSAPAFAQDETPADTAPPSGGIIFLKPPERALLGENAGQNTVPSDPVDSTVGITPIVPIIQPDPPADDTGDTTGGEFASIEDEVYAILGDGAAAQLLRDTNFSVQEFGLSPKYRINLSGTAVTVPAAYLDELKLTNSIFDRVDFLELGAVISTRNDWVSGDIGAGNVQITSMELENVALVWGGISFYGGGVLDVDSLGQLNGTIDITFTAWNPNFNLGSLIGGPQATGIEILLSVLTSGDALTLPIVFEQGVAKIGQQVLGIVPPIR